MVKLGELMRKTKSLDPRESPAIEYSYFSIPAFDSGAAFASKGSEIGSSKIQLQEGDVLLSKLVPHIRRSWVVPSTDTPAIGSSEWIVFNSPNFDPNFLRHFLTSDFFHGQFMSTVAGVGGSLNRARPAAVAEIPVPLPPLDEQRRIAGILDRAAAHRISGDEAIDKLHRLSEWLVSELTQQRGVVYTPLGELLESIESGKSPKCESYPASDGEWGVLKLSAVTKGRFVPSENKHLPDPPSEVFRREVQEGDILMTRKNTPDLVGAVCIARKVRPRLAFPDLVFRLRINQDQLLPSFFHALMMSPSFRDSVRALAVGSAKSMSNISQAKLRGLEIPLPPMDAQLAFDEKMRAIYRQIDLLDARQGSIKELHSTLHARAFQE